MKRRITIEVDDAVFPKAKVQGTHIDDRQRMICEVELGLLIGPMQVENQRTNAVRILAEHGVVLISDEQL